MEFFIWANSNAAPFVSDSGTYFAEGESAEHALKLAREAYSHPAGLYAMNVYDSSDAFHKNADPVATWRSPLAKVREGVPCDECGKHAKLVSQNIDGPGLMAFYCPDQHRTVVDEKPYRALPSSEQQHGK